MEDGASSKARLAQELLAALRVDRNARPAPRAPGAPSGADAAQMRLTGQETKMTDTIAQGHQKRSNKRFTYPVLRVLIGTKTYSTIDWSIGGLMVGEYTGDVKQNSRFKLTMSDGSKNATYFGAEGRAARIDRTKKTLSVQFMNLSKGGFEWLSGLQMMQRNKGAPGGGVNGTPSTGRR